MDFTKLYEKAWPLWSWSVSNQEELGTAIANEEVLPDGTSERGGYPLSVNQCATGCSKSLPMLSACSMTWWSWLARVYHDMQRNWIENQLVPMSLSERYWQGTVFTTALTLFGDLHCLAPEHDLVGCQYKSWTSWAVTWTTNNCQLLNQTWLTDLPRKRQGFDWCCQSCQWGKKSTWIADYVLASYGTGAVSGRTCPRWTWLGIC